MPRQDGRRAIITGGNIGIGYEAALELARHGASVVIASRTQSKADAAATALRKAVPGAPIEVSLLDLASLASVRDFAARELARPEPLDLLINNAGVYAPPKRLTTADGFELQFGTNVLGHFALTGLLLPKLEARGRQIESTGGLVQGEHDLPRIVTIASIAHKPGRLHFDDLQFERSYKPNASYQQSKLANLMLALELHRRLTARGIPIRSIAAHPGVANTNLFKPETATGFERRMRDFGGHVIEFLMNSSAQGALPTLYAAAAPDAVDGGYYGPRSLFETRGAEVFPAKIADHARNEADAQRLWSACESLSGVHFLDERLARG